MEDSIAQRRGEDGTRSAHSAVCDPSPVAVLSRSGFAYKPNGDPVNLDGLSTIDILKHCFAFICPGDHGNTDNPIKPASWNGNSIEDLYKHSLEEVEILRWISENNNIDLKTDSKEEIEGFFLDYFNDNNRYRGRKCGTVMQMLYFLKREVDTEFQFHDRVRSVFNHIGSLLNVCVLQHGSAIHDVRIFLPQQQYSLLPNLTATTHTYRVQPDVLYCVPDPHRQGFTAKFVAQVYTPTQCEHTEEKPAVSHVNITDSLPVECRDDDYCVEQAAGQHVLQLLSLAYLLQENGAMQDEYTVLGGFLRKQNLYFSKLTVSNTKLLRLSRGKTTNNDVFGGLCSPYKADFAEVEFSNWCLDLTKPRHRLALLVFLYQYLEDNKGPAVFKQTKDCLIRIVTYSGSDVTLQTLQRYCKLVFHAIPEGPSCEQLIHLDIPDIMEHMACFVTNSTDLTGKMMMDSLKRFIESDVDVLYKDRDFHINFKDGRRVELPESDPDTDTSNYRRACVFMQKMAKALIVSRVTDPVHCKHHHAAVKAWLANLCELAVEKVIDGGESRYELQSTMFSKRTGQSKPATFTPHPDLLLTSPDRMFPGIPFEIYSPTKKQEITRASVQNHPIGMKEESCDISSTTGNQSYVICQDSEKALGNFLSENVPVYMCEKSRSFESHLKGKFVAQQVLQILSVASDYSYSKWRNNKRQQLQNGEVFIGLSVCDEYIYITKIQGDESHLLKYSTEYIHTNKPKSHHISLDLVKHRLSLDTGVAASHDFDPEIHVQFSPIVLDLSIHNHRMALLLFMKYYIAHRTQIKCLDIRHGKGSLLE